MAAKKRTTKKSSPRKRKKTARSATSKTWTSGRTELSGLSKAEKAAWLGYHADEAELAKLRDLITASEKFQSALSTPRISAPSAIDWRNNNGNWVSPIRNQKSCGSCVSFATIATVESRLKIECRDASRSEDFSESHLFFCGCGQCCGTGWNFAPALDFAKNTGLAPEAAWPYQPTNEPCRTEVTPTFKITAWKRVLSIPERKQSLAGTGPMVAGMQVFDDFYDYTGGVYNRSSNQSVGYHAISVVGYDDSAGCWICKNSWGTGWGENGFFRIAYGECGIDTTFPFYEVEVPCLPPKPTEDCRRYVPYLIRVLRYARTNPRFRACLSYYVCRSGTRPPMCSAAYLRVARSVASVLKRCPQYRRPFCNSL